MCGGAERDAGGHAEDGGKSFDAEAGFEERGDGDGERGEGFVFGIFEAECDGVAVLGLDVLVHFHVVVADIDAVDGDDFIAGADFGKFGGVARRGFVLGVFFAGAADLGADHGFGSDGEEAGGGAFDGEDGDGFGGGFAVGDVVEFDGVAPAGEC